MLVGYLETKISNFGLVHSFFLNRLVFVRANVIKGIDWSVSSSTNVSCELTVNDAYKVASG